MRKEFRTFVGDFETTVYEGQTFTEVWASALVEIGEDTDPIVLHSIGETFNYLCSLKSNIVIYYHNLKFDGSFWLDYFLVQRKFKQGYQMTDEGPRWKPIGKLLNHEFTYSVSDRGQWYTMTIRIGNKTIEFRDSLKLLPFSVKQIGQSFKTPHQKLDMEYTGYRYAGCPITAEEERYIKNDVMVVKEALEIMFNQGHKKLTIGACCLNEYKKIMGYDYQNLMPDLSAFELDPAEHKYLNADEWIRKSYRGGWCHVCKGKELKRYHDGITLDVNSLYPSMMHSMSGNRYPCGTPTFWTGDQIPAEAVMPDRYFFVRFRCRFYLKEGYLPFVQIKDNLLYRGNVCLETSDVCGLRQIRDHRSETGYADTIVELTMTQTDFLLFQEHYNIEELVILDGCWFKTEIGIFDEYIDKYRKLKMTSKGAIRQLAKLFLNNLYGKLASSSDNSFKIAFDDGDGNIGFDYVESHEKKVGYIAIGSAITSYARNFTIRASQANYYGVDKPGWIYSDTDSIHLDLPLDQVKGVKLDDAEFCCWKAESSWDEAIFTRQKTYIEHVIAEDLKPIEHPYYDIKGAGMMSKCKRLLNLSLTGEQPTPEELAKFSEKDLAFIRTKRELEDFKPGIRIPGELKPKRIPGGIMLVESDFEIREPNIRKWLN